MKVYIALMTGLLIANFSLQSLAQQVVFDYDNAGNRISRTIVWEENKNDNIQTSFDTTYVKSEQVTEDYLEKHAVKIGEQTVNIYPNPNTGMFKIMINGWHDNTKAKIKLFTLAGTVIIEKIVLKSETKIKFGNQPDGTYILSVTINGKKETWKVIKK